VIILGGNNGKKVLITSLHQEGIAMNKIGKILLVVILGLVFSMAQSAIAKDVHEFTLSVDTVMDHPRNQALQVFIKNLEGKSKGRLKVKFYHSAQLYKDKDILKALTLGTVDVGLPGIWFLDKLDPNAALPLLPMFYGRDSEVIEKLVDGKFGELVNQSMEKKMKVKIPGRWYGLGYTTLHTTKRKITNPEDLKGLRIRYFGSKINAERLRAMGATPVPIPWPDMPMALMRGTCDGLITSLKALHSAKLVDAGITYSLYDKELFSHYVPMCSEKFWKGLPADLQKLFIEVWNEHVPMERELARKMQKEGELAVDKLQKAKGGGIYRPSNKELAKWRQQIMHIQDPLVKEMGMDRELVNTAMEMLGMK
jgi:TRAP-type C4-dicarboxylate transport system substrate-binding protein